MHKPDTNDSTALHEGSYHYRKLSAAITGAMLVIICTTVLILLLARGWERKWEWWENVLAAAFPGGILTLLGVSGGWLLMSFFQHKCLHFRITAEGIDDNGRFTPWLDVGMIGAMCYHRRYCLWYQKKRRFALTQHLMQDPLLTWPEMETLLLRLEEKLRARFPHLNITG